MVLDFESLPKTSGLYYFYDNIQLLYIGKAAKLKYRIKEHYKNSVFLESYIKFLNDKLIPSYEAKESEKFIKNQQYVTMITSEIISSQWIDLLFNKVNLIKTELFPIKGLTKNELSRIIELKPLLNRETRTENNEIRILYEKCRRVDFYLLKCLGW